MRKKERIRGFGRASFGRARGNRKLRLESLESRRLLAGDACNLSSQAIDESVRVETVSQGVLATSYAADAAGATLKTAADLGHVEGVVRRNGRLSRFDTVDIVRFEVANNSAVRFGLDQLNRDADLYLLNRKGSVISSNNDSAEGVSGK